MLVWIMFLGFRSQATLDLVVAAFALLAEKFAMCLINEIDLYPERDELVRAVKNAQVTHFFVFALLCCVVLCCVV